MDAESAGDSGPLRVRRRGLDRAIVAIGEDRRRVAQLAGRVRVAVERIDEVGLEAAARDARYDALRNILRAGEYLLSAHHADDQLETMLFALVRGAGLAGLSAMPATQPFAMHETMSATRKGTVRPTAM